MKHLTLSILMLLVLGLMTACVTAEEPIASGEEGITTDAVPTQPLTVDASAIDDGSFLINFGGKYTFELQGEGIINPMASDATQLILSDDTLSESDDIPDASALLINIPQGTAPGNYELVSFVPGQTANGIHMIYTNLENPDSGETLGTVLDGQINLASVSPFTGAFEVTFDAGDGEILTARGAFNSIE